QRQRHHGELERVLLDRAFRNNRDGGHRGDGWTELLGALPGRQPWWRSSRRAQGSPPLLCGRSHGRLLRHLRVGRDLRRRRPGRSTPARLYLERRRLVQEPVDEKQHVLGLLDVVVVGFLAAFKEDRQRIRVALDVQQLGEG